MTDRETTALLERAARIIENDDWRDAYDAFRSGVAAQPAAPTPVCKCGTGHQLDCPVHKPAAPTPDITSDVFAGTMLTYRLKIQRAREIAQAALPDTFLGTGTNEAFRAIIDALHPDSRPEPAAPEPSADTSERAHAEMWMRQCAAAEAQLTAVGLPPHEQTPDVRAQLLPRLEVLSNKLCQTQGYILKALNHAGLTVALLTAPSPGAGEEKSTLHNHPDLLTPFQAARNLLEQWNSEEPIGGIAQIKLKKDTTEFLLATAEHGPEYPDGSDADGFRGGDSRFAAPGPGAGEETL